MKNEKIFNMSICRIYPALLAKIEKKGRTKDELDQVITWLTGYKQNDIEEALKNDMPYGQFFENAPSINPKAKEIKGSICGVKVQEIEDPLMQKIRWLDKLVDDLAKDKDLKKILMLDK